MGKGGRDPAKFTRDPYGRNPAEGRGAYQQKCGFKGASDVITWHFQKEFVHFYFEQRPGKSLLCSEK